MIHQQIMIIIITITITTMTAETRMMAIITLTCQGHSQHVEIIICHVEQMYTSLHTGTVVL